MKANLPKKKIMLLTLAMILCVATVYATYTVWQATITWQVTVKQFVVKDEEGVVLTSPYSVNLGVIDVPTTKTFKFFIENDGNVPITVNVVEVTEGGCTGTWNQNSFAINVGEQAEAVLTLTITGEGSYAFKFTLAP